MTTGRHAQERDGARDAWGGHPISEPNVLRLESSPWRRHYPAWDRMAAAEEAGTHAEVHAGY